MLLHKKMTFSIKDFFSKCDQIRSFLRIWSHLLKKSLRENFIFCAVCKRIDYESSMLQDQVDWYLYPKASIIVWNSFSFVTPFWCYMYLYVFRMK